MYQENQMITEEEDKENRYLYSIIRVLGILDKFPKNKKILHIFQCVNPGKGFNPKRELY